MTHKPAEVKGVPFVNMRYVREKSDSSEYLDVYRLIKKILRKVKSSLEKWLCHLRSRYLGVLHILVPLPKEKGKAAFFTFNFDSCSHLRFLNFSGLPTILLSRMHFVKPAVLTEDGEKKHLSQKSSIQILLIFSRDFSQSLLG